MGLSCVGQMVVLLPYNPKVSSSIPVCLDLFRLFF